MKPVLAALAVIALASPAQAQDCAEGQRVFGHAAGETCIPEVPQRIAATRGDRLTTPLLDIGAPMIAAGIREMDDGSTYVRGASDILGQRVVDAADLINLGDPNAVDIEALATARPDLIFARENEIERRDQFEAIAPTVFVPRVITYFDHLEMLADAAGMAGAYAERRAEYDARIEEARVRIGEPSSITVSRIDIDEEGLWFYPDWGAVDRVIQDIGFARPEIQAEASANIRGYSAENIREFDGDILLGNYAPRFGQSIEMLKTERWAPADGLWQILPGVQAGCLYWYDRDVWNGNAFASLHAAIDGLTLLTAGREFE